jgi:adenylate cyclase
MRKPFFDTERLASLASRPIVALFVVVLLLAALPVAAWLDLASISERTLRTQANAFDRVMTSIRNFYSSNIVNRVLSSKGEVHVVSNYHDVPGGIPIPATLSLELGKVISEQQGNVIYRFISDYPFANRAPHAFDSFEREALAVLRRDPQARISELSGSLFDSRFRLVAPIIMRAECVSCHNAHPDSPKHDWTVGDVRGIQEIIIDQSIAANLFSFKYLLLYFAFGAAAGGSFIALQRRQAAKMSWMNRQLQSTNSYLPSRARSPNICRRRFTRASSAAKGTSRSPPNARSSRSSFPTSRISRRRPSGCSRKN